MEASNDLLGDPAALQARMAEDSYLYFRQVLDPEALTAVRHEILRALAGHGWVEGGYLLDRAVAICQPVHEGVDEFAVAYDDVQRGEAFHSLAHDATLLGIMREVLGPSAFPHPLKVARLAFPEHYEVSTPPHQDYPNNQGTPNLTASWIPLGDCPMDLGGIAILRGSHRWGLLPLEIHPGPGNRQAQLPQEMLERCRWVTTDFSLGDVLLFPSLTVHAALHNASEFNMRVSVDFRYQLEGEALTELVLHPHFQRLEWDDIYAGWSSDELRYYWHDLDFEVVPFEDLLSKEFETAPDANLHSDLADMAAKGEIDVSPEDWGVIMKVTAKRKARYERRMAKLSDSGVTTSERST
jgi:hypothetical protein